MDPIGSHVCAEDDVVFEYELQRTPHSTVSWQRYLDHWKEQYRQDKTKRSATDIIWLYERFVQQLGDTVDPWAEYIAWLMEVDRLETHKDYGTLILNIYARCLEQLSSKKIECDKMCLEYVTMAVQSLDLAMIRRSLDTALRLLKHKNNHAKVWELILTFIQQKLIPLTEASNSDELENTQLENLEALIYKTLFPAESNGEHDDKVDIWTSQILKRYLIVCPVERRNEILLDISKTKDYPVIRECFERYLLKPQNNIDNIPFSLFLVYLNTLENLTLEKEYERLAQDLKERYPDEISKIIINKANHYINVSKFTQLVNFLNEKLKETKSLKDFIEIYNYFIDFEQAYIHIISQELENHNVDKEKWNRILTENIEILNELLDSRELKLNDLKLRQNANNVSAWLERVQMVDSMKDKCEVFSKALLAIDPIKVTVPGHLSELWCEYAQIYWDAKDYDSSREIYNTATKVPFPFLEDLEKLYSSLIENELNVFGIQRACTVLSKVLLIPESFEILIDKFSNNNNKKNKKIPAQTVLFNSLKLWTTYIDLLESQPTTDENINNTIVAYEHMIELKLVTPLILVNYAEYLRGMDNYMGSYKVYERALSLFPKLEIQYEVWIKYLTEVVRDSIHTKIDKEYIRDLFEQAILTFKNQDIVNHERLYLLYNSFEEENTNGSITRRSIDILLQGAETLSDKFMNSKISLWNLSLEKSENTFGKLSCRPIYEMCIEKVPIVNSIQYIIKFAQLETSVGEWKRVRELLTYGAKLLAPTQNTELWGYWSEFEIEHGSKEKYKEMLQLKKKLEDEMKVDTETISKEEGNIQFVMSTSKDNKPSRDNPAEGKTQTNPEEIELDI